MKNYVSYLHYALRLFVGTIFIWACSTKILDPSAFAREIGNYHIVPFGLENSVAIILPWLELLIGLGLIFGFFVDANALISGSLLILFNMMVIQAMIRGFNIECGCGLKEGQMIGFQKLFENFLTLAACIYIIIEKNRILNFYPKKILS